MSCDNPACFGSHHTPAQIKRKILRLIRDHGWAVMGVMGSPGFAYTIGLTAKKMPELYVDLPGGLDEWEARDAQAMLNDVARYLLDQEVPAVEALFGQVLTLPDPQGVVRTVLLSRRLHTSTMVKAREIYGARFTAVQVTLTD